MTAEQTTAHIVGRRILGHAAVIAPRRTITAHVSVPGDMRAIVVDGRVVRWVWMPAASNAGYFGPAVTTMHAYYDDDTRDQLTDTEFDALNDALDVNNVDGDFWSQVQHAGGFCAPVEWEE
jgi:hypothetical protein